MIIDTVRVQTQGREGMKRDNEEEVYLKKFVINRIEVAVSKKGTLKHNLYSKLSKGRVYANSKRMGLINAKIK
jgi:hypothetical protein